MAVLCFQSYVVKTPHHTILVDACIGNDKSFPQRPTWHRKTDSNWMRALEAAGVGVDDIDFVMCTHLHGDHVGWNTRLENGRWVPTFPKAKYLFSKKGIRILGRRAPGDPARPDGGQRAADHRRQQGGARDQRLRAQRPHPADADAGPHARPLRGLRRSRRRPGGVHRRSDPFADPGALSRPGDARRLRPAAGVGHPPRLFRALLRHRRPCAARCISPRLRSATSSAGATASATTRSAPDLCWQRLSFEQTAAAKAEARRLEQNWRMVNDTID